MDFAWVSIRCLLLGHDDLIRRESDRMYLECCDCGRATRGWTLGRDQRRAFSGATTVKDRAPEFAVAA